MAFVLGLIGHQGDECVPWPYGIDTKGYGMLYLCDKVRRAHRVVCEFAHGPAARKSLQAAHSCGNRKCVNPKHLSWKSGSENQRDRRKHGTHSTNPYGSRSPLSQEQIEAIRRLKDQKPRMVIAREFGTSTRTVERIHAGRQYLPPGQSQAAIWRRQKSQEI